MDRISLDDLTAGQLEQVEIATGLPLDKWDESPSRINLFVNILAVATGRDISEFRAMKMGELNALVDMSGEDPQA